MEILLSNPEIVNRTIYVFIDGCISSQSPINAEVFRVASDFQSRLKLKIFWSPDNLGVRDGVPTAISWISEFESQFIILEDDCFPLPKTLKSFDQNISRIDDDVLMISGFSPESQMQEGEPVEALMCKYPMIWGWATSAEAWIKLKPKKYSSWELIKNFVKSKQENRLGLAFFIAAQIRVEKGTLQAWDAPLALNMLTEGHKCLVPTKSLINNVGNDSVASHIEIRVETKRSSDQLVDCLLPEQMEKKIEKKIYGLKNRHYLAPIKAILNL